MCSESDNKKRKPTLIWIAPHCSFDKLHNRQSAHYATRPCGTIYKTILVCRTTKNDRKVVRDVILLMFIDIILNIIVNKSSHIMYVARSPGRMKRTQKSHQ